jgi:hypothetical protein
LIFGTGGGRSANSIFSAYIIVLRLYNLHGPVHLVGADEERIQGVFEGSGECVSEVDHALSCCNAKFQLLTNLGCVSDVRNGPSFDPKRIIVISLTAPTRCTGLCRLVTTFLT